MVVRRLLPKGLQTFVTSIKSFTRVRPSRRVGVKGFTHIKVRSEPRGQVLYKTSQLRFTSGKERVTPLHRTRRRTRSHEPLRPREP